MKKLLLILIVLSCILSISAVAFAASSFNMYVQPSSVDAETVAPQAVGLYKKNSTTFYLFLPAGMDASDLRVKYEGASSVTIGDTMLVNGEATDLFSRLLGQTVQMKHGSKSAKLTVMQSANLNAVYLTTESGTVKNIEANKNVKEAGTYAILSPDGEIDWDGDLNYIKGRGNGSFMYAKKPYEIELQTKEDLFGMGKAKRWLLISNHIDYSLIRNKIAYDMALEVGMEYAIHSTFIDLYINHEYRGCYLMTEKVEVGNNRVEIEDLSKATKAVNEKPLSEYKSFGTQHNKANTRKGFEIPNDPEDITGGYLVEIELSYRYKSEASGIVTKQGQPIVIKSPKYASKAQVNYIGDLLQGLENALFSTDGIDSKTGKHWYDYIDRDSFVTLYVLEETVKNYDANRSSLFFYKPADSVSTVLKAGPGWDFDQSFDNYGFLGAKVTTVSSSSTGYHWYPHAIKLADFFADVQTIYTAKFKPCLEILLGERENGTYLRSISDYEEEIRASSAMNFSRWLYTQTTRYTKTGKNHNESIQKLKTFVAKRRIFLESYWKIQ